jgi:hypothetical protein
LRLCPWNLGILNQKLSSFFTLPSIQFYLPKLNTVTSGNYPIISECQLPYNNYLQFYSLGSFYNNFQKEKEREKEVRQRDEGKKRPSIVVQILGPSYGADWSKQILY